jgi:hypothetical protein
MIKEHIEPSHDLVEANDRISKLFIFSCLETLGRVISRITIPQAIAI